MKLAKLRTWLLILVLVLAVLAVSESQNLILAGRLLVAMNQLASGATGENAAVTESHIRRPSGSSVLDALVYRPSRQPAFCGVVLVPGISELGCYHPRLQSLSRTLAGLGLLVLTPDITSFRNFEISPASLGEITFWYQQLRTVEGSRTLKRTGLAGISFSATLALIAAAQPGLRDSVDFVFGIGPYDEPMRCSEAWFAAGKPGGSPDSYPTRFYAKWIIMLAALDMVPNPAERQFLETALRALLLQKKVPQPPQALSAAALRWYRLAVVPEGETDPGLTRDIQNHLKPVLYAPITPGQLVAEAHYPVFLVHGASDDLIPPEESLRLQARIGAARCHVLISPFLTHTHPLEAPLGWTRKTVAVFETFWFLNRLARTVR